MASTPIHPKSREHIGALDGIRGMAILLVLFHHLNVMPDEHAVDAAAGWLFGLGWAGVDLFFVLSGFLITGILVDAKGTNRYFVNFYARRTVRIFPLYYAVVFASLFLFPMIANLIGSPVVQEKIDSFGRIDGDEWYYWSYLSNFAVAKAATFRHGILDISWSLAIEEQFYIVWPTIVYFLSTRRLMHLCTAVILATLFGRCVQVFLLDTPPISVYAVTYSRIDALLVGAWIALAIRTPSGLKLLSRVTRPAGAIGLVGLIAVLALDTFLLHPTDSELRHHSVFGIAMQSVGYTMLAITFGSIVARIAMDHERGLLARSFSAGWLRFLGKYSYAIYLFHLPIRAVLRDVVYGPPGENALITFPSIGGSYLPAQLVFYVVATAPVLVAALLSWHLYEKHFLKLKRYFPR